MRAIRRFTIRPVLPEPLAPLRELMLNLRWSWHAETLDLFADIDPGGLGAVRPGTGGAAGRGLAGAAGQPGR